MLKKYCLLVIENNSLKYLLYAKEIMQTNITINWQLTK